MFINFLRTDLTAGELTFQKI